MKLTALENSIQQVGKETAMKLPNSPFFTAVLAITIPLVPAAGSEKQHRPVAGPLALARGLRPIEMRISEKWT